MTYLTFLLVFIVPPTLALAAISFFLKPNGLDLRRHWLGTGILAVIALVWTTPWDNYLVAQGIWTYGPDRVLGTLGTVPFEEYAFMVLETALNASLLALVIRPGIVDLKSRQTVRRVTALGVGLAIFGGGLFAVLGSDSFTYLGLILVWFLPPVLLQWLFDPGTLLRNALPILLGTLLPATYLTLADSFALHDGIWSIPAGTITGWTLGNVPIEEFTFFAITSLLVAQGLVLWHSLPTRS